MVGEHDFPHHPLANKLCPSWRTRSVTTNKFSDLSHLNQFFEPYHPNQHPYVYLICRVSSPRQEMNGTLAKHRKYLMEDASSSIIRGVNCYVGPSTQREWYKHLTNSSIIAKELNCVLLAYCVDRYIRPGGWSVQHPEHYPTLEELNHLKSCVGGINMATVLPPSSPFQFVKSIQGKKEKKERVPSPCFQDQRREKWYDFVLDQRQKGCTLCQIRDHINKAEGGNYISHVTIDKWTKEVGSRSTRLKRRGCK